MEREEMEPLLPPALSPVEGLAVSRSKKPLRLFWSRYSRGRNKRNISSLLGVFVSSLVLQAPRVVNLITLTQGAYNVPNHFPTGSGIMN